MDYHAKHYASMGFALVMAPGVPALAFRSSARMNERECKAVLGHIHAGRIRFESLTPAATNTEATAESYRNM